MIEQRCKLLEPVGGFIDLWQVEVPSYYSKDRPLPSRMGRLYKPAAIALDAAMIEIASAGGHLLFTDMFRSYEDQLKAHRDYLIGKKSAFSPQPGGSMHEAGSAFDLDPGNTGIGLAKVKTILLKHGWHSIAASGSECWHHDWPGPDGLEARKRGYRAMARHCIGRIENLQGAGRIAGDEERVKWIQEGLNQVMQTTLAADGDYGEKTRAEVIRFQVLCGLIADGIVGPITEAALNRYLKLGDEL